MVIYLDFDTLVRIWRLCLVRFPHEQCHAEKSHIILKKEITLTGKDVYILLFVVIIICLFWVSDESFSVHLNCWRHQSNSKKRKPFVRLRNRFKRRINKEIRKTKVSILFQEKCYFFLFTRWGRWVLCEYFVRRRSEQNFRLWEEEEEEKNTTQMHDPERNFQESGFFFVTFLSFLRTNSWKAVFSFLLWFHFLFLEIYTYGVWIRFFQERIWRTECSRSLRSVSKRPRCRIHKDEHQQTIHYRRKKQERNIQLDAMY